MIAFQPIEKEKIAYYGRFYQGSGALGCEANIVSGYLWNEAYKLCVAVWDNTLIKAYFRDDRRVWGYCMPAGENVRGALDEIFSDAAQRGSQPQLAYLSKRERELLETLCPDRFDFEREPENQDYIYLSRDLATLAGKKFHAKRNHISKFYRTYGDDARFCTIDESNLSDAVRVMERWCRENDLDPREHAEYAVFCKACDSFEELRMHGGLLYVDNDPVAMTMGSEISPQCFDVIFEKALRAYDGVYAVINNEFAKTLTKYTYMNREEDLGLEGLRKAKLSYNPVIIYDRFSAVPK